MGWIGLDDLGYTLTYKVVRGIPFKQCMGWTGLADLGYTLMYKAVRGLPGNCSKFRPNNA